MTRRRTIRRRRAVAVLIVVAAVAAALGSSSPDASTPAAGPRDGHRAALGVAGGSVPDGTTVFDDQVPGVAKLDPALLGALRRAASDSGVRFVVDSGWRSPAYQQRLLRDAVREYGSAEEAARWVATPDTSEHVSGDAVDIAASGAAWLSANGAAYGLCQVYANEPWHFELRSTAEGCPPMYSDPTNDPRMHP